MRFLLAPRGHKWLPILITTQLLPIGLTCLLAQNSADDPGGWTKAKWGSTGQEIKTVFPEATMMEDPDAVFYNINARRVLGLKGYLLEHDKFSVTFSFDEKTGLDGVTLDPENRTLGADGREFSGPPDAVAVATKTLLLSLLTDTYGKPTQTSQEATGGGGTTSKWEWMFPKTRILLSWTAHRDPDYQHLDKTYLLYIRRKKNNGV